MTPSDHAVVDAGEEDGAAGIGLPDHADERPVIILESGLVKVRPLDIVYADGKDHKVRHHQAEVPFPVVALEPGLRGGAVYPGLGIGESAGSFVQINPFQRVLSGGRCGQPNLRPVRIAGHVEPPQRTVLPAPERIFLGKQQHRLPFPVPDQRNPVECKPLLHHMHLPGQKVNHRPGRCISRRHRSSNQPHLPVRLKASAALPHPCGRCVICCGRICPCCGKRENQAAAAVHSVPQGQEMVAEPAAPCSSLHVGPANMQHPHASGAVKHQGIRLAEETSEIRGITSRKLHLVPLYPHKRIAPRLGGQHRQYQKEADKELFHLAFLRR